jgi:hypothetical protein
MGYYVKALLSHIRVKNFSKNLTDSLTPRALWIDFPVKPDISGKPIMMAFSVN